MTSGRRNLLVTVASCLLLAAAVVGIRRTLDPGAGGSGAAGPDGWYGDRAAAERAAADAGTPLLVLWGDLAPDPFERAIRRDAAIRALAVVRCRVDAAVETAAAQALRLRTVPSLVVLDPAGAEITRLEGPREIDDVVRTLRRAVENPVPRAALEGRAAEDVAAARRLVEVYLESAFQDSALRAAEDLGRRSAAPGDSLLVARALIESGRLAPGAELAAAVAAADPALAAEARWYRLFALIHLDRPAEVDRAAAASLSVDTVSAYARRVLFGYGIQYLVQERRDHRRAIEFMERFLRENAASPLAAEAKYLAANLHGLVPADARRTLELYRQAIGEGDDRVAERAEEVMVGWARRMGHAREAADVLRARVEAADPETRDRVLFHLALLEATSGDTVSAIERWTAVGAGEGERADDALLSLGVYRMEAEADLEAARASLQAILDRFGDRETAMEARYHLGRTLVFLGRFRDAAVALDPLSRRADLLGEEARRYLEFTAEAERDPQTGTALVAALTRRARGAPREALDEFEALARNAPASPLADDALLEAAKTAIALRDGPRAERALRRVLSEYRTANQYPAAERLLAAVRGRA